MNQIHILNGRGKVASYYSGFNTPPEELEGIYRRGGYLHPIYTPDGTAVTNHLNVGMHPHHSGIWSAWTRTRYGNHSPDFWKDRKSTRLNSSHVAISYAVFCLKKKNKRIGENKMIDV